MWTERRNKKEPRTRSAVEQMVFPVSGCGTRGFAAQTVLARDDTEKPHLLPTAPAIVRPANTPPLVVVDKQSGFNHDLFFSHRFELQRSDMQSMSLQLQRTILCDWNVPRSRRDLLYVCPERQTDHHKLAGGSLHHVHNRPHSQCTLIWKITIRSRHWIPTSIRA